MKNKQTQQTAVFQNELEFIKTDGTKIKSEGNTLSAQAGTVGTWVLTLTVLAESIEQGEQIKILRYNFQIANQLQNEYPKRRDYVTVTSTANVQLDVGLLNRAHGLVITIGGRLKKGDKIIVKVGDRDGGSAGSEVFWTTTLGRLETTLVTSKKTVKAADDVFVNIVSGNEPKCLRLLGPTIVAPGEKFSMNLAVFEINRNVVESFTGTVNFEVAGNVTGLPAEYAFTKADKGIKVFENISIDKPGIFRVKVCSKDKALQSRSNPVICEVNPAARIYWGDLHAHSWGDCEMLLMYDCTDKNNPFSRHKQARLVGRFDYSAPGPMAMPDGPERKKIWQMHLEAFDKNNQPGVYVPFMAMEMHPGLTKGDRTIIFRNRQEQIPPSSMKTAVEKVYELYGARDDALLETHIGGSVPYFEEYKPENEKLVEVVSAFGNAEWLLQKNLQAGFHPAITGASDLHLGLFGAPRAVETFRGRFIGRLNVRDSGFGNGPVGAIIADRCTRESLWESLLERKGYATTGDRIYIKFRADDFQMGQIANLPEKFNITLTVSGQEIIEKIDLIVGINLAKSFFPNKLDVELDIDFDRQEMPPGKWFYFRIKQANSEYAWTAPIWFANDINTKNTADFPPWNHYDKPPRCKSKEMQKYLRQLEEYLTAEGDREIFSSIEPVGLAKESMGNSAKFISVIKPENYPVTIRWFYEYQIPKIRVDWGYENFGPVDCQKGPDYFK